MHEGNLEPPKRHPIDWRNPDFYNEGLLMHELERVYDVCHGCRRCFNLCTAFPTLFDLVDESKTGELDSVDKKDFWKVVDQCYLCDMCFMTKCPYVPPHPLNVDFPHLMLRAKAVKFERGEIKVRDRILSSTDAVGRLASIPVVTQVVNKVNQTPATRAVMEKVLGVAKERELPEYASATFRKRAKPDDSFPVRDGKTTPGKVAIFATCYVNYNEPGIGHDLLKILEHNEIPALVVKSEVCCGMPKFELGDLESVAKHKEANIPVLAKLAREGYAILAAIPSCTLMFKQELPLLFPDDADVMAVQEAMYDPFEYLMARHKDGLLKLDFKVALGKVSYHIPCHGRVQKIGRKTEEVFKLISQTVPVQLNTVERCSGHAGTYGVKSAFHETAMKIGKPVFKAMAKDAPDYISSDCALAGHHIAQGMAENALPSAKLAHPLSLMRIAYGLE